MVRILGLGYFPNFSFTSGGAHKTSQGTPAAAASKTSPISSGWNFVSHFSAIVSVQSRFAGVLQKAESADYWNLHKVARDFIEIFFKAPLAEQVDALQTVFSWSRGNDTLQRTYVEVIYELVKVFGPYQEGPHDYGLAKEVQKIFSDEKSVFFDALCHLIMRDASHMSPSYAFIAQLVHCKETCRFGIKILKNPRFFPIFKNVEKGLRYDAKTRYPFIEKYLDELPITHQSNSEDCPASPKYRDGFRSHQLA